MSYPPIFASRAAVIVMLATAFVVVPLYDPIDSIVPLAVFGLHLAWLASFALAALGLGGIVAGSIRLEHRTRSSAWVVDSCLGAALMVGFAGALGFVGALSRLPLLGLLAAGVVAGVLRAAREVPLFARGLGRPSGGSAAILVALTALTLLASATPAPFYDQYHYHLAFPEQWLGSGSISVIDRHTYSYFPANMGLLYVYALAGPGSAAAQAINWWAGAIAVAGAFVLARRLGAGRGGAWWAATLVAATPAVALSSTWAGSDLGVAAFGAGALVLASGPPGVRERSARVRSDLVAGALAGCAFGCKYLALATVGVPLVIAVLVLARSPTGRGPSTLVFAFSRAVTIGAGLAAAFAPWAARNWVVASNPVYPFFGGIFEPLSAGTDPAKSAGLAEAVASSVEPGSRLLAALSLRTFDPLGEAGEIGPAWLVVLAAWLVSSVVFARRRAEFALLAFTFSGIAAWSQFHQLGRYLVPVLIPAAAGAALAVTRLAASLEQRPRRAFAAMLTALLAWSASGGVDSETLTRIGCTLGHVDRDAYLEGRVSYWRALGYVNGELPAGARVLLVAESRSLSFEREVVVEDPFRVPLLVRLVDQEPSPDAVAESLAAEGVTHVLFNEHEADRISRLNSRSAYLQPRSEPGAHALSEFFDKCLEPLARRGPAVIYRLKQRCGGGPASRQATAR